MVRHQLGKTTASVSIIYYYKIQTDSMIIPLLRRIIAITRVHSNGGDNGESDGFPCWQFISHFFLQGIVACGHSFLTFPSKYSSASLALQDLKIEFISSPLLLSPGNVAKSLDPEDVSDDLRAGLVLLNGASKDIKQNHRA
jgi:hypothetical protein